MEKPNFDWLKPVVSVKDMNEAQRLRALGKEATRLKEHRTIRVDGHTATIALAPSRWPIKHPSEEK